MNKISVIIPSFNRCYLLKICLRSLEKQTAPNTRFEVIVVVDGSTDKTVEFLKGYRPKYPFRYLYQKNKGLSAARNIGNKNANHDLILCLDDDIIASPQLIEEHLLSHERTTYSLVQGALKIHNSLTKNPYLSFIEKKYLEAHRKKEGADSKLGCEDISGGNISLCKEILEDTGGFDEDLKRNTDGELAYRLEKKNIPMLYNGKALGYLVHVKSLKEAMNASSNYGRAYVVSQKKHPETIWKHSPLINDRKSFIRKLLRIVMLNFPDNKPACLLFEYVVMNAITLYEIVGIKPISAMLYRLLLDFYYWKGVYAESCGKFKNFLPKKIPVLCYHAVSEKSHKGYSLYTIPTQRFVKQIEWIKKHGYKPISLDRLYNYLSNGSPLPAKPIALTFDDGYREHKQTTIPLLNKLGFHHIHFINTGKLGKNTNWIKRAPDIDIFSPEDIREIINFYGDLTDFQAHGNNHESLKNREKEFIYNEVYCCIEELSNITQKPPHYMAYPYGDYDDITINIMPSLGLLASFSIDQGLCSPNRNLQILPRVEIFGNDLFIDFIFKIHFGWSPVASLRKILKRRYKKVIRRFKKSDMTKWI